MSKYTITDNTFKPLKYCPNCRSWHIDDFICWNAIESENALLRRIIYECCGLSDFQRLGIDQELYNDIVREFESGARKGN